MTCLSSPFICLFHEVYNIKRHFKYGKVTYSTPVLEYIIFLVKILIFAQSDSFFPNLIRFDDSISFLFISTAEKYTDGEEKGKTVSFLASLEPTTAGA